MPETDSLFADLYAEENLQSKSSKSSDDKKISVTFANYIKTENVTPEFLFQGFDELRVITYSLGLEQVEKIMKFFKRGQVIIGSYKQISGDVAEMLALQKYAIDYISKNSYLQKMIKSQAFRFYVTDKVHAKIYLLKSDDGRCRVISASANFSANAWQKRQMENFVVMDEVQAYEDYLKIYEDLRRNSSDEIDIDARPLKEDGTNLERMPAIREAVYTKTAVVIHELPPDSKKETEFLYTHQAETKKFQDLLKNSNVKTNPDGQTLIIAENVRKMKKIMENSYKEKKIREKENTVYPKFILNFDEQTASFNGELWDLNPSDEEVKADLQNLIDYVEGIKIFVGDTSELRMMYWKVFVYMFVSPFFARLRYFYDRIVPANSTGKAFPMYMILRGKKNGGKSSIVTTGQKLMFDQVLPKISSKKMAASLVEDYKINIKGCPMLIDDVSNTNLRNLNDIVKDDYALISGAVTDHGTFIFTSNGAEQIKQEISKRVVVFTIRGSLNEDIAIRRDAILKQLQNKMSNALYRHYLAKIFPAVEELAEEIQNIEDAQTEWFPDIFKIASKTLIEIFQEYNFEIPPELKIFCWEDYLGEEIKSEKAVDVIADLYKFMPQIFYADKANDILTIDFSSLDQKTAQKINGLIDAELPPSTYKKSVGNIITMKLSETEKFAKTNFSKDEGILQKFFNLFK